MERTPLRDAFVKRDKRFLLLDKGLALAGFSRGDKLLEVGCAGGEAALHMTQAGYTALTAVDIDPTAVDRARAACPSVDFVCADACDLPFVPMSFDGIISEASFALIPDKAAAAREYARVLRPGGRVLLNDFALKCDSTATRRDIEGIPCLEGVQTAEKYIEIFQSAGFKTLLCQEEFPELVRIAMSLSREYAVPMREVGRYIQRAFGNDNYVNEFFEKSSMSYFRIIFEKE